MGQCCPISFMNCLEVKIRVCTNILQVYNFSLNNWIHDKHWRWLRGPLKGTASAKNIQTHTSNGCTLQLTTRITSEDSFNNSWRQRTSNADCVAVENLMERKMQSQIRNVLEFDYEICSTLFQMIHFRVQNYFK